MEVPEPDKMERAKGENNSEFEPRTETKTTGEDENTASENFMILNLIHQLEHLGIPLPQNETEKVNMSTIPEEAQIFKLHDVESSFICQEIGPNGIFNKE